MKWEPKDVIACIIVAGCIAMICLGLDGTIKWTYDARGDVRVCLTQFGIIDSKVSLTVDTTNNTIVVATV